MLLSGGGHPALPFLQKLPKAIHSACPSPMTKCDPPKWRCTISYRPLFSGKLSSCSSQKIIVVAGFAIRLRLNPTIVCPSSCRHALIAYMKYGVAIVGDTVVLVALGHVQMPFVRGVGGVLALYKSQSFGWLMYGGRTLNQAFELARVQTPPEALP